MGTAGGTAGGSVELSVTVISHPASTRVKSPGDVASVRRLGLGGCQTENRVADTPRCVSSYDFGL